MFNRMFLDKSISSIRMANFLMSGHDIKIQYILKQSYQLTNI